MRLRAVPSLAAFPKLFCDFFFAEQRDVVSPSMAARIAHGAAWILEAGVLQLRSLDYPLSPSFFSSFVAFNEQSLAGCCGGCGFYSETVQFCVGRFCFQADGMRV